MSLRSRLLLSGSLLLLSIAAGCSPDVVVLSDPLFEAILPSREAFEREMSLLGRDNGVTVGFAWPDAQLLDQIDYAALISASDAPVFLLSPYASLFAEELARRFPERRFLAIRDEASDSANVITVRFDWSEGWRRAGRAVGMWLRADPDRSAIVLTSEQSSPVTADPSSFREAVEAEGAVVAVEILPNGAPREAIINSVTQTESSGETLVVLMMGQGNVMALEALRETAVLVAAAGAYPNDDEPRVLFGIHINLVSALEAHLGATSEQSLLVPAGVVIRPAARQETEQ